MDKEILTMEEAAEIFGVSVKTFIKLLKEEKVPARKIGREWRFSKKALIEWLSTGDSQSYSSSEGDTREFFDEVAPEWEEISKNYYDESIKNKLLNLQILDKSMKVMDLGSGDGYLSRAIARSVKQVVAVDISGEMLKALKKKAKESGLKNIEVMESDGQDVQVGNESIDMVCANMYLHHIEVPEQAVKEMNRIVKPGGRVFISDFVEHGNQIMKEKMHDLWPGFKISQIEQWFREKGFKEIRTEILTGDFKNKGQEIKPDAQVFVMTAVK